MELISSPEKGSEKSSLGENLKLDSALLTKAVIELMKQDISTRYKQTGEVTDKDWEFCELIDWHPVDELPMKESFIKELEEAEKGPHSKFTLEKLDKLMKLE